MRRPPSSALKDRLQQRGLNEVIINHWGCCVVSLVGDEWSDLIGILCRSSDFHSLGLTLRQIVLVWISFSAAGALKLNDFSSFQTEQHLSCPAPSVSASLPAGVGLLSEAARMGPEITECCLRSPYSHHL